MAAVFDFVAYYGILVTLRLLYEDDKITLFAFVIAKYCSPSTSLRMKALKHQHI